MIRLALISPNMSEETPKTAEREIRESCERFRSANVPREGLEKIANDPERIGHEREAARRLLMATLELDVTDEFDALEKTDPVPIEVGDGDLEEVVETENYCDVEIDDDPED